MGKRNVMPFAILIGMALLAGIFYRLFCAGSTGSPVWTLSERLFTQSPPTSSSALPSKRPLISSMHQDTGIRNNIGGRHTASYGKAPAKKDIFFITQNDVDHFRAALFLFLYRASLEYPVPESGYDNKIFPIPNGSMPLEILPGKLREERFETQQFYLELLEEKQQWDRYQQDQYKTILESTVEPEILELQYLNLVNEDNMAYFVQLKTALKLHTRLLRDIRIFNDEVQFQKNQPQGQPPYQLYELKFKLSPFARESALSDALQQAMSTLSIGVYQQEAMDVIERLCDEFIKPVRELNDQQAGIKAPLVSKAYNYNIYMVFAKKLMGHATSLSGQSSIHLMSSSMGALDHINRRLFQSFNDLYQIAISGAIPSDYLNLDVLEKNLYALY